MRDIIFHQELRIGKAVIKNIVAESLVDFRTNIHSSFPYRSDATVDLIDAIASNISAKSPVELSLNPLFHRQYGSFHDAVDNFLVPASSDKEEEERTGSGNKPITVGHSFSVVAALPEKNEKNSSPWVMPLLIRRVPTDKKAIDIGAIK